MKNAYEFEWEFDYENENGEICSGFTTAYYRVDIDRGGWDSAGGVDLEIIKYEGDQPDEDEQKLIEEAIIEMEWDSEYEPEFNYGL